MSRTLGIAALLMAMTMPSALLAPSRVARSLAFASDPRDRSSRILCASASLRQFGHTPLARYCGIVIVTVTPLPSRLASEIRPPCASAISRTSARPRPVPPRFVE